MASSNLEASRVAKEKTGTGREVMKENRESVMTGAKKEDGYGRMRPLSSPIEKLS